MATALYADNSHVYVATDFGIIRSSDSAKSWDLIVTDSDYSPWVHGLFVHERTLLAATEIGLNRYSFDSSADQWTLTSIVSPQGVGAFASTGETIYLGTELGQVQRSYDLGLTWREIGPQFGTRSLDALLPIDSSILVAWGQTYLVLFRPGISIGIDFSAGLPPEAVAGFARGARYVWAGIDSAGVWKRSLVEFSSVPSSQKSSSDKRIRLVATDALHLIIEYESDAAVPRSTLELYDILGKLVFTTTLEPAVSGWNRASCSLPSLPGGTYVCRVSGGGFGFSRVVQIER